MSLILRKINVFAKKVANLPPKPGGTMPVADLQAQFDAAPEELRAALNGAIDDIIADYATKAELSGIQLGQITDGTVTPAKLSFDPATQAELNAVLGGATFTGKTNIRSPSPDDNDGIFKVENTSTATGAATNAQSIVKSKYGTVQLMKWENFGIRFGSRTVANGSVGDVYVTTGNDAIHSVFRENGNLEIGGFPILKTLQGAYTGDGSAGPRFINVGFTPKIVIVTGQINTVPNYATSIFTPMHRINVAAQTLLDGNNNLTTNGFNIGGTFTNANTYTFGWTAWG